MKKVININYTQEEYDECLKAVRNFCEEHRLNGLHYWAFCRYFGYSLSNCKTLVEQIQDEQNIKVKYKLLALVVADEGRKEFGDSFY